MITQVIDNAEGGEHGSRAQAAAETFGAGIEPAVQQDDGERHTADRIGNAAIVEDDTPGTVLAGQHADRQKHQQQRHADSVRERAGEDGQQQQHGTGKDELVDKIHDEVRVKLRRKTV